MLIDKGIDTSKYTHKIEINSNGEVKLREYEQIRIRIQNKPRYIKPKIKIRKKRHTKESSEFHTGTLARSRNDFLKYYKNNKFASFITLTFDSKKYPGCDDINTADKYFKKYIRKLKTQCEKNGTELIMLGVREFQDNGNIHYHILTNIEVGSKLIPIKKVKRIKSKKKNKWYHIKYYDLLYWDYGYSFASEIDGKIDLGLYLAKYLTKFCDTQLFGRRKILKAGNLAKHKEIKLIDKNTIEHIENYLENKKVEEYHNTHKRYQPNFIDKVYQDVDINELLDILRFTNNNKKMEGSF